MQLLDWPFLDALQAGALLSLFISFGTDALSRRDKMMGWLALTCLLVGFRHGTLSLGLILGANPDSLDRAQSLLVAGGFITLCLALTHLFPHTVPRRFALWVSLAMVPNLLRNLVLAHPSVADTWAHNFSNLVYLVGCGWILAWTFKARRSGDPMGRRLFLGFLGVTLPVVVEIAAFSLFNLKIRLSGFSLVILAMAIGTSWQWLVVRTMEARIRDTEQEATIWRSLVPGPVFRTNQPSQLMEAQFGKDWSARVIAAPDASVTGADGFQYHLRSHLLPSHDRIGWLDRDDATQPGTGGFLSGWSIALGLDDSQDRARIQSLLQSWGAKVNLWGTVPPREGPYPSVLIWGREPSILAVWREHDLQRRRPRWIQIGGPSTEGPHARLEGAVHEARLQEVLEGLLSRH